MEQNNLAPESANPQIPTLKLSRMTSTLITYESLESRKKGPKDYARFLKSLDLIRGKSIEPQIILISSIDEVEKGSEATDLIKSSSISILPITEYEGVIISFNTYPSDQELVDYLDVPDGILNVSRSGTLKDMEYGCGYCGITKPKF